MLVQLDASEWHAPMDFLLALRVAIGSPDWQGWSPDAFIDTIFWDGCNRLQPPCQILVTGVERAPTELANYVHLMSRVLAKARADHTFRIDIDVTLTSDLQQSISN